jgi:hypothetical protein
VATFVSVSAKKLSVSAKQKAMTDRNSSSGTKNKQADPSESTVGVTDSTTCRQDDDGPPQGGRIREVSINVNKNNNSSSGRSISPPLSAIEEGQQQRLPDTEDEKVTLASSPSSGGGAFRLVVPRTRTGLYTRIALGCGIGVLLITLVVLFLVGADTDNQQANNPLVGYTEQKDAAAAASTAMPAPSTVVNSDNSALPTAAHVLMEGPGFVATPIPTTFISGGGSSSSLNDLPTSAPIILDRPPAFDASLITPTA